MLPTPRNYLFLKILFILLFFPLPVLGGTTQCPRYSVQVTGTSSFLPGYTYTSTLDLQKIGSSAGYNGKWRVVRWVQENTYPHRTDQLPIGPLLIPSIPQFGGGQSMYCVGQTHGKKVTNVCQGGNLTFNVTSNHMGPASHPIGRFTGKTLKMRFDPHNPNEPMKTGQVHEFPARNLSLDIMQPTSSAKVVFSAEDPGKLKMKFSAKANPSSYDSQIQWKVPEISGSNRTLTPANATGADLEVTYTNLPAKNSAFGKKTVSATLDAGGCQAQATREFSVFFPRDATNHPGGGTPNWFYYWSQTKAKKGPAEYGDRKNQCGPGGSSERLMGYYRNTIFDSVYYICDLSQMGPDFPFQTVKWVGNLPDNRKVNGIDTFAAASHHENAHYEHYTQWWKAHATQNKFKDTNRNGIKDSVEQQLDKDGDEVPDAKEAGFGMDPTKKSTLGAGVTDEEAICWKEEAAWAVGSADQEDWAHPGKQWK